MFKKEEKVTIVLAAICYAILLYLIKDHVDSFSNLYFILIPIYLVTVNFFNNLYESRERVEDAVSYCLDESDFNVIDNIENLRLYFKDTKDVIDYLSVVDSKVLTFAFDQRNVQLRYKEYVVGAVRCLCTLLGYTGSCYFNINAAAFSEKERVTTLLGTLYMVAKLIEKDCKSINILSRFHKGNVVMDAIDHNNNHLEDQFCDKLFDIFSSEELTLSHANL